VRDALRRKRGLKWGDYRWTLDFHTRKGQSSRQNYEGVEGTCVLARPRKRDGKKKTRKSGEGGEGHSSNERTSGWRGKGGW